MVLVALGAACSGEPCPPAAEQRTFRDPAVEAEHHLSQALLVLLRQWNDLDTKPEAGQRRVLGQKIMRLVVSLCDKPVADWRIDIATTPVEEYFDLSQLENAGRVDCVGLVVKGRIVTGPAFRRPK